LIVKSPSKTAEIEEFLGYEWSSAKGKEGIKYLGSLPEDILSESEEDDQGNVELEEDDKRVLSNIFNLNNINTPLYDPQDKYNREKINFLIAQNFKGLDIEIPESLSTTVNLADLVNLIDFSKPDFNKAIGTSSKRIISIETKWETKKTGDIGLLEVKKGTSITQAKVIEGDIPVVAGGMSHAYFHNVHNRAGNTITISASGANAGYVNFWRKPIFASDCTTINSKNPEFIFYVFNLLKALQSDIFTLARGAAQPHVYPDDIKEIRIPLPPADIQKKIVRACQTIDKEQEAAEKIISDERKNISTLYQTIYSRGLPTKTIDKISLDVQYGINDSMNTKKTGYKIFRMNEIVNGYMIDNGEMKYVDIPDEEFKKYKLEKGDILFNRTNSIEHVGKTGLFNLDGDYCYASYLIRIKIDPNFAIPEYVNYLMNSDQFQSYAKSQAAKSINQANINATKMKNISIPVPNDLKEQKKLIMQFRASEERIINARKLIQEIPSRKSKALKGFL